MTEKKEKNAIEPRMGEKGQCDGCSDIAQERAGVLSIACLEKRIDEDLVFSS